MCSFRVGTFSGICNRNTSSSLGTTAAKKKVAKEKVWRSSYSKETLIEIRRLYEHENWRICDLAKKFDLTKTTITNIVHYMVHRTIEIE